MGTNQDAFMNGINQIISKLINGPQPAKDPGMTAWTWLGGSTGTEASQVDDYMKEQIGSNTITSTSYSPTKNWATWSNAMNTAFGSATGSVASWLQGTYSQISADPSTVPEDVITWTKQHMPTNAGEVVVTSRVPSRVGGGPSAAGC